MTGIDVLHVIPFGSPSGGAERYAADLLESPVLEGLEQRVVFLRDSPPGPFREPDVFRPQAGDPFRRLVAARRSLRPRVVASWLYPCNLAAAVTSRIGEAALVTGEQNLGTELSRLRRLGERIIARAEDVGVANSSAVRSAAIARVPRRAGTLRVILPGIADRAPTPTEPVWDTIMIGRLHPVKDHACALEACAILAREGVLRRVAFLGDGPEHASLAAHVDRLGLAGVVDLVGNTDPLPYLNAARSYLSTSVGEGWSRAMLEALRAGLPVVSTAVGGAIDLEAPVVRLAPVGDAPAIASALRALLGDEPGRVAAGAAARECFVSRFRAEICHAAYRDLFRDLGAG